MQLESAIKMGADYTIAVNLYGLESSEKKDEKYNNIDIIDRSAKIVLNNITHLSFKLNKPDLLIEPPIDQFRGWDFHKAKELIDIGYEEGKKSLVESELFT